MTEDRRKGPIALSRLNRYLRIFLATVLMGALVLCGTGLTTVYQSTDSEWQSIGEVFATQSAKFSRHPAEAGGLIFDPSVPADIQIRVRVSDFHQSVPLNFLG